MKVKDILQAKQPDIVKKLNKKRKRRSKKSEHLSFRDFDRMMRERADIDRSKCRGR